MRSNDADPTWPDDPLIVSLWQRAESLLLALGGANLVLAVVVKMGGGDLHPLFSDPDAALLFLVTGLGLLAHAGLLVVLRWRLRARTEPGSRPLRHLRGFMRLPIHADYAGQRGSARLRRHGRPSPRRPGGSRFSGPGAPRSAQT
ncbi:MAG: hypothetical protein KDH20_22020 [Rhodocyclaceae bacterium]|nr:hypothetical protein [Rhodocyclaceae bacterium]